MAGLLLCGFFIISQSFGQNKIQYRNFDFRILSTEHFDIYFSQGGEELAAFAEDVLEDGYSMLSENLGVEVSFRIPAILYNSPNDFSQTNVTLDIIEESVGGFTEILKNRMVVPFTGNYEDFRHVLVHELTHVFQFSIFFPSKLGAILSANLLYSIPLWVMEGHAEFSSLGWDLAADIFMRDLIMNNNVIPLTALGSYSGYIIYKEGQAFFNYVDSKYGPEKTGELIHQIKGNQNLDEVFTKLFGLSAVDFNEKWIRYYRTKYYPKIELQNNFYEYARVLYNHKKTNSLYNTSTAISSNGDKIAFISDRSGVAEVIIISSVDGKVLKKLAKAEYSSGYEGLHLYRGGLSWSPDDKYLALAAKAQGKDVLYILNVHNGRLEKKLEPALDGIYSPKFSTDGTQIVFSGLKNGRSDIYILNVESAAIERITDDIYADEYPDFSPDGQIAFVSDRPDSNKEYTCGSYAVFLYANGRISRMTPRTGYMASPFFDPTGGLFFVADYDTVYNLYWYSEDDITTVLATDILTGIYYPTISKDGSKIAFSYYNDYGYDVCVVKDPLTLMDEKEICDDMMCGFSYGITELDNKAVKAYRPKFTVDYISATASYYTALGVSGECEIGISDILGDHYIQGAFDIYRNFVNSDLFLGYWYLKKKADFGIALSQQLTYFGEGHDLYVWRYLGGGASVQYPLNRFLRAELGIYAYKVYETQWLDYFPYYYSNVSQENDYNLFFPALAVVFDNIKWGLTGPNDGCRLRIEGYATVWSDLKIRSCLLDCRRYFRLSPRSSFALRLVAAGSFGPDIEEWSIGGQYSLRGYDYYAFSGSKLAFLNLEYRFPFIDSLKISFPLPLRFRNIRGVLFSDFGGVYTDSFKIYETEEGFHLDDLKMGFGVGLRFAFFNMIWQLDVARAYDFRDFTDDWKFHWTIGSEW